MEHIAHRVFCILKRGKGVILYQNLFFVELTYYCINLSLYINNKCVLKL